MVTQSPALEPALRVVSINIEGFSQNKSEILSDLQRTIQCDVMRVQEIHRDETQPRPEITGLTLIAETCHPKHGTSKPTAVAKINGRNSTYQNAVTATAFPIYAKAGFVKAEVCLSYDFTRPYDDTIMSGTISQLKKMDLFTSSDSGLENLSLLENVNITLVDMTPSDSILVDFITDDVTHSSSPLTENIQSQGAKYGNSSQTTSIIALSSDHCHEQPLRNKAYTTPKESTFKPSKEDKQKQNEDILESSSLSSETGSWESVFPPKLCEKEACAAFLINERHVFSDAYRSGQSKRDEACSHYKEDLCPSLVQKSPFKSASCFIDAASLVDDEEETIKVNTIANHQRVQTKVDMTPAPSQPMPFSTGFNTFTSTIKTDESPNDWSEELENEDSLDQRSQEDPDSLHKDLLPTIFEMTLIAEDSLCAHFDTALYLEKESLTNVKAVKITGELSNGTIGKDEVQASGFAFPTSTPNNSIMSLRSSNSKPDHSEDDSDSTIVFQDNSSYQRKIKDLEYSPIVSGGASIEDHLPQVGTYIGSPGVRRKVENIPIVAGAYVPEEEKKGSRKNSKPSGVASWVVDVSNCGKSDDNTNLDSINTDKYYVTSKTKSITSQETSSSHHCKNKNSVDPNGSDKSSQKFYIDLSSLEDPVPPKANTTTQSVNEKKNMFSMYIDLGEKSSLKEIPARLSSSLSAKKNIELSNTPSGIKTTSNSASNTKSPNSREKKSKTNVSSTPKLVKANNAKLRSSTFGSSFEVYEGLCSTLDLSNTVIENMAAANEIKTKSDLQSVQEESEISTPAKSTNITGSEAVKVTDEKTMGVFVRLSDLDKPKPQADSLMAIHENSTTDMRMTRSIPDYDQKHARVRPTDVFSSFHSENALSLNRLFPHLKNEFSKSMPGSLSRTRSPITAAYRHFESDDQPSDLSELSSVQSSYCRSVVENSTTEESQSSNLIDYCQSKLGQDLLKMFLEEIAPDVVVEVSGRRLQAHKCILSSRCQYFAAILSGGWVESAGNVILLPSFSFNAVHFALCHIYSGVSTIPDSINIVELATIADMLGLEGLKEAIMFSLKVEYCHNFHTPCHVCTAGVLECFHLSSVYGLDDLNLKCLRWIGRYFHIVWPTKDFAALPKELLDKCYQQHIVNMTVDNLPYRICCCGMIVGNLQNSRWAETVESMCRRLLNAGARFAAPRLVLVFQAVAALPGDSVPLVGARALHDCLSVAIEWAPPDEACRAYEFLSHVVEEIRAKPDLVAGGDLSNHNNLLWRHAKNWQLCCENSIVRLAPRVVVTQAFQELAPELRKRLRELGCVVYFTRSMTNSSQDQKQNIASPLSSNSRRHAPTRSLDMNQVRALLVPYVAKPSVGADVEQRANFKSLQVQHRNEPQPQANLLKNIKPRYLEQRVPPNSTVKPRRVKMMSSSESSRNSSPVQASNRAARASRLCARNQPAPAMSQDSLASRPQTAEPSTDSQTESQTSNRYATYTKAKHSEGSDQSVKPSARRSKIPVLQTRVTKRIADPATAPVAAIASKNPAPDPQARKGAGSLMMATKSSSAKVVNKVVKATKPASKPIPKVKGKATGAIKPAEPAPQVEIPAMERSETFLKNEPMFRDQTTDIDAGQ